MWRCTNRVRLWCLRVSTYSFGIKNEKVVIDILQNTSTLFNSLQLTPGSGNQKFKKEDLYNNEVLVQVKSTNNSFYRLKKIELETLYTHARASDLIPVLVVYFPLLKRSKILLDKEQLSVLSSHLDTIFFEDTEKLIVKNDLSNFKYSVHNKIWCSLNTYDFK